MLRSLIIAIATASPILAQDTLKICLEKATTQFAMNACANEEAERADAERTKVYGELLAAAKAEEGAAPKIEAAERAWTAYRDASLEAMFPPTKDMVGSYGSIFRLQHAMFKAEITFRHIQSLKTILERYQFPQVQN